MSIKRNTAINVAGAVAPMLIILLTVPLYIRLLGEARYGVLSLVWLVLGYFSFLELGLGKATANQLAKASKEQRSEIFWTAFTINLAMGVFGAAIIWMVGTLALDMMPSLTPEFRAECRSAMPWLVASFPLALASSVLNGALEGRNQFLVLNVLQVLTNAIFLTAPLAIAYWHDPGLGYVIPAAVLSRVVMNLFFFAACFRYVPLSKPPGFSKSRARSLFSYGGWVAISGIAVPILETIERVIVGAVLGAAAVTVYTVPMQLAARLKIVPAALCRATFPRLSAASHSESVSLARRSASAVAWALGLVTVIAIVSLRPFLSVWIDPTFAEKAAPIGEIMLLGVWLNGVAHVPYFYLQARGQPEIIAKIHMIELTPYLLLAWFATSEFGLMGTAAVWTLRGLLECIVLFYFTELRNRAHVTLAGPASILTIAAALTALMNPSIMQRGLVVGILVIGTSAASLAFFIRARRTSAQLNSRPL